MNLKRIADSALTLADKISNKQREIKQQIDSLEEQYEVVGRVEAIVEDITEAIKYIIPNAEGPVEEDGYVVYRVGSDEDKITEAEADAKNLIPGSLRKNMYIGSGDGVIYIDIDFE